MTYTSSIPVSGESLGSTRDRIRTNFQEIATVNAVNHVAFNSLGEGKHKFLQMPEQASAPTTLADEGGLYTKVGTGPAETNLFFRAENSGGGGGFEYQMTKVINASTATFATNTTYVLTNNGGWTFLPGGLLLQYGRRISPTTSGAVTFPVVFPSGLDPFSIVITAEDGTVTRSTVVSANSSTFSYTLSSSVTALNWIAIGN